MEQTPELSLSMSISRKVNMGNYESADAFLSVSGITANTTTEEIEALLDGAGNLAFKALRGRMSDKPRELRAT